VVVFDADMVAKKHFFLRILEPLTDPKYALCLSPQVKFSVWPHLQMVYGMSVISCSENVEQAKNRAALLQPAVPWKAIFQIL
jgi:hypothetical protein